MKHTNTSAQAQQRNLNRKLAVSFLLSLFFLIFFSKANAQEVLTGLTSNGGPEGRGTAFSIKTNGSDFSVVKGFSDWGKNPDGDLYKDTDGNFYGMTSLGGTYTQGTIFKMTPTGIVTVLKQLNGPVDGGSPHGELIKGTDGNFYGLNSAGGTNTYGTIFKMTPAGVYTVLKHLSYAADGTNPRGHLIQAKDGNFYGITYGGGANGVGTIFKITPAGVFTVLRHLNKTTDGGNSYSSLTEGKDGNLYGITYWGGSTGFGTIFKITTGGVFTVLRNLVAATDGSYPQGDLTLGTDGNFYGSCYSGGTIGNGTIFKITPAGAYTVLRNLSSSTDGGNPYGNLFQNADGAFYGMNRTGGAGAGTAFKITTAGVFTKLHAFVSATEGSTPNGGFAKGADGNLYALTSVGGTIGAGTAFKMTTTGTVTNLVNFNGSVQGNAPFETLTKGKDSAYYGLTSTGGTYGHGTIFKICGGVTTVLRSFNKVADGGIPYGSLVQATDGNFYGMTSEGGTTTYGTIFRITPAGVYTVLRNLVGNVDGSSPQGSLIQGSDGLLYGMTRGGGSAGFGTIFKISLTGVFTVIRSFVYATDGANPEGDLLQAADGNFYGMTSNSAKIFKLDASGTFTIVRSLVSNTDGSYPLGSLIQAADGKLYGMTSSGGQYGYGSIFNVTTAGVFKVMKFLNALPDGRTPKGRLLLAKDGNLYGMTSLGGTNNLGTIFKITPAGAYTVLRHFSMATDGGNPFGSLVLAPINNLVANTQSVSTNEEVAKAITLTGSGSATLTYGISSLPKNGSLSGSGANIIYTPAANYTGLDSFYFRVSVGCMSSAPAMVRITVNNVADAPVLATIGNKTVAAKSQLTFTASATDADAGQTLKYSLIGAPSGAIINASTGVFTYTPTAAGSASFKVRVTDNGSPALYYEESITVTVTATLTSLITNEKNNLIVPTYTEKISASLYPNPATNQCFISLNTPVQKITIRIVDVSGKTMSTNTYESPIKGNLPLDVSKLNAGIYFAQIQTAIETIALKFSKQ